MLGLPLMVAIIGRETQRFRPLVDIYREYGRRAGHSPEKLKVGIHAVGYVADTTEKAVEDFFPGYAKTFSRIGKERGWPPITRAHFDAARSGHGAMMLGNPKEVAEKILRHSEALGGISRITFQMDVAELSQANFLRGIELLGTHVAPIVRSESASSEFSPRGK
jgi:alkanesulfonate monooxygenase SsuD/methylene tetrahydromethanopterin reductase-like flavin-dependent oxidoreductase (luciferase family)